MAFPIDSKRDKHFQMMLDYLIREYGEELGTQYYEKWLDERQLDETRPMVMQKKLKSLPFALESFQRKTKGDNPLQKMKNKLLNKLVSDGLKKDMKSGELYLYKKKIEENLQDSDLVSEFEELGDSNAETPDPQDLKDLKRYYATATQLAPTSIDARSAKALFARTVEKMISEGKATREQIEKYL